VGRRRVFVSCAIALAALALAPAAGALRFTIHAPGRGSIVIAEVKGNATGRKPVRLTLLNRRALGRTIVASATWRARNGTGFDGIVVLLNPRGASSQRATFGSGAVDAVQSQWLISGLAPLLQPTSNRALSAARRAICANNVGRLASLARRYAANPLRGVSASTFLRQACGAAMDEVIPGAPEFWSRFGLPFCGFYAGKYGSAGNEFQFHGTCNRALEELDIEPPSALTATGCVRFARSDCAAQAHRVAFSFLTPPPAPYAELSGARVRVSKAARLSDGWLGLAQPTSGNPFGFRFDPTPGRPRFPF
jgi:hypothetical protein